MYKSRWFSAAVLCLATLVVLIVAPHEKAAPEALNLGEIPDRCFSAKFEYAGDVQLGYKYIDSEIFVLTEPFASLALISTDQAFPDQNWVYRITFNWQPEPRRNEAGEILVLIYEDHMEVNGVSYVGDTWDASKLVTDVFGPKYRFFDYELHPYEESDSPFEEA